MNREYKRWLEKVNDDTDLIAELQEIDGQEKEIEDRFYRNLEFGTGGLRGVIGAGTNRMNIFTVRKASQGLAYYLHKYFNKPSVAIAYDSRIKSRLFAETAAGVFAANNIQVYMYSQLMPTPALSFAVRQLQCSGGIVITASHNPAKYNGYKVYGSDGCQITTQAAKGITQEIESLDIFSDSKYITFKEGLENGRISFISENVVTAYLKAVATQSVLAPDIPKNISIVYTPLNGAGISCVPRCLTEQGFDRISIPEDQKLPDGNFPTCPYPNPEIREALDVGLRCAKETNSDLLLATDPDCDRVGAAVRTGETYTLITGNQMGVLLLDFICKMRIQNGTMPVHPVAVKTIVTTEMAAGIARHYGVELCNVLTGFKYIGEQIGLLEKANADKCYIFGFEESYGYLSGSFVRDKDGVNAALLICEMYAYYKAQGKTLIEKLEELYQIFGAYTEKLCSFEFEGAAGDKTIQHVMTKLRSCAPREICGQAVMAVSDYLISEKRNRNGRVETIQLPKSNVLKLHLQNGAAIVVRPSGTEPKLKVYVMTKGETIAESEALADQLISALRKQVEFSD